MNKHKECGEIELGSSLVLVDVSFPAQYSRLLEEIRVNM
jgi:hypothetical protein